jgi:hypothetical protein
LQISAKASKETRSINATFARRRFSLPFSTPPRQKEKEKETSFAREKEKEKDNPG